MNAVTPKKDRAWILALGSMLVIGCGAETPPASAPDAGPPPDTIRAPIDLITEVLAPDAPYWAGAQPNGAVLAAFEDRLQDIRTGTSTALNPISGRIVGVGALEDGLLVAASDGYYVLQDQELVRSPLSDAANLTPFGLLSVAHGGVRELWLAGQSGIAVWSGGQLNVVHPEGLPVAQCVMTFGAKIGDQEAVWMACEGQLYALTRTQGGYLAHLQTEVIGAHTLAVDDTQTLWSVDGQGTVWSRSPVGVWRSHDFASDVEAVFEAGKGVWFRTMTGLWHHDNSGFAKVMSPTPTAVYAGLPGGQVLLQTSAGLARGFTEREVRIVGLAPDSLLEASTRLTAYPVQPQLVEEVRMTLDGVDLSLDSDWGFELDPRTLQDGSHELVTSVDYDDGQQLQATLRFSYYSGPAPTWSDDVSGIYDDHCSVCHWAGGGARVLDSSQAWQTEIEDIINNVRSGRMPLPPNRLLSAEQIERIEGWKAAGYPEGE